MHQIEFPYIYHGHTERCGHASGKDLEIINAAINHGVKVLCMTDHTPIPGQSQPGIRMEADQIDEYISTWKKYQEQFKDKLRIYIGLEVEYSIEHHDYLKDYLINKGLDFIICGEHCYEIDGKCYWCNNTYKGTRSLEDLRNSYVEQVCDGMNKGLIKYLAHPDCYIVGQKSFDENIQDSARKIIETAIKNDVILEFNVHGIWNHNLAEWGYPNAHFWKFVKVNYPEAKITIGLDCHSLMEYEDNYLLRDALKVIESIGLNIIEELNIENIGKVLKENWSKE